MKPLRLLALALSLAGALSAQTTYLSNTGNPAVNGIFVFNTQWLGYSFTTGANAGGYTLNSINLSLSGGTDATFAASLWSDAAGAPGASLATFTTPATGVQFDLAGGYGLGANATYWVVLSSTAPVDFSTSRVWNLNNSLTASTLGGWTYGSAAGSSNSGASWSSGANLYLFDVTATAAASAVPEPSTYAALAGLAALGFVAWRRSQISAQ